MISLSYTDFRYHPNASDSQIHIFSLVRPCPSSRFHYWTTHSTSPLWSLFGQLKLNMSNTEFLISLHQCSSLNKWYHYSFSCSSQKTWNLLLLSYLSFNLSATTWRLHFQSTQMMAASHYLFSLLPWCKPTSSLTYLPYHNSLQTDLLSLLPHYGLLVSRQSE